MAKLRLSPSGPEVGDVGPGFQLRQEAGISRFGSTQAITASNVVIADLDVLTLDAPEPTKRYSASLFLDVANVTSATLGTVTLTLQASYDEGVIWNDVVAFQHNVTPSAAEGHRQIRAEAPIALGSNAQWDMPADAEDRPSIQLRAVIKAAAADVLFIPTDAADTYSAYIEIKEYAGNV